MLLQVYLYVSTFDAHIDAGISVAPMLVDGSTPRWFFRTVTASDLLAEVTTADLRVSGATAIPPHLPRDMESWWRAVLTVPLLDGIVFQPCYTFRPTDRTVCPPCDFLVALRVLGRVR